MGVTFDLVLANITELEQVAAFAPLPTMDVISTKLLDQVTLAQLHALISPITYDEAIRGFDIANPAFTGGVDGPWVYVLLDDLVTRLAELTDEGLQRAASDWAETEEIQIQQVDMCFLIDLLWDMRKMAGRALNKGKSLLLRVTF